MNLTYLVDLVVRKQIGSLVGWLASLSSSVDWYSVDSWRGR